MSLRTYAVAATAAGLLAVAVPAANASAADAPAASGPPPTFHMPALDFVPPRVGPISVDIGRTIINGQIISQGVHVLMPGVTVPPLS